MDEIKKALLSAKKLPPNTLPNSVVRQALLQPEHIRFITRLSVESIPTLTIYDRDLDGTTGLAGGIKASENKTLHKNWFHTYAWSHANSRSSTFGASVDQIRHFYTSLNLPPDAEVVIFTVDNGSNSSLVITEARKEFKNIKFFITDHHKSKDNTQELADFYINPTDLFYKNKSDWILFEDQESHVSGGMLWNLILKEINFHLHAKPKLIQKISTQMKSASQPELKKLSATLDKLSSNPPVTHNILTTSPTDEHMRLGLISQYCDLITFAADWEQSIRVNIFNNNIQKTPIFQMVNNEPASKGMTNETWRFAFKDKIQRVSSIFNTIKRLDFLLSRHDFEKTLLATGLDIDVQAIASKLNSHNDLIGKQLSLSYPSLIVGNLPFIKYAYLFALIDGSPEKSKVIADLAYIKKTLYEKNAYSEYITDNMQFYFTENPLLSGLTSIASSIGKRSPVLFNLHPSGPNQFSGSYRSDIASLYDIYNSKKFKHGSISLIGHNKAAGVTLKFTAASRDLFFAELEEEIVFTPKQLTSITLNEILSNQQFIIENQNFYVFSQKLLFRINKSQLIDENNVKIKTSKLGNRYISHNINGTNLFIQDFSPETQSAKIDENGDIVVLISVGVNNGEPKIIISVS